MPFYCSVGEVPRKRHLRVAQPGGGYLHEELMGTDGFSAESALLYHRYSPSAIVAAEAVAGGRRCFEPDSPLVPRHLRTGALAGGGETGSIAAVRNHHRDLSMFQAPLSDCLSDGEKV